MEIEWNEMEMECSFNNVKEFDCQWVTFLLESDVPDETLDTHSSIERKKSTDSSGSVLKINLNIEKRF